MLQMVSRKTLLVAVALCAGMALAASQPSVAEERASLPRLAQEGHWFVDPQGRVVTIRGGNIDVPAFEPGMTNAGQPGTPWSAQTPREFAKQGFNGIRLVIFLAQLMPQPGVIDKQYLERIARTVREYANAGIYTLIDFHQDEYGAAVGVRGMPDWAVLADGHAPLPGVEFPMGYFRDPAVQHAFDNFWANRPVPGTGKGVQDFYVDGLVAVAKRFHDDSSVLGIDVMNEPATGSRCAEPDPVSANCPQLEQELLRPFYEKVSAAIARAAPEMMIFVEPFMLQGALGTPINTPVVAPEGRRGFSFHNYGPVQATRDTVNDQALAHATRSRAAIINTEWGFDNDPAKITGQANDFDRRNISWLAWPRGAFATLVDHALPDQGNGNRVALLRAYARPYPQATAGTPLDLAFDAQSGQMHFRYSTVLPSGNAAGGALTEIRIPAINFPHGFAVQVEGAERIDDKTTAADGADAVLRLRNLPQAETVDVRVTRVGELPPLPASEQARQSRGPDFSSLPPIPPAPLTRNSLLGHIVVTPGGRGALESVIPGMLDGLGHVHGWEKMTLSSLQVMARGVFTEEKLRDFDAVLVRLQPVAGPVRAPRDDAGLSLDTLVSDLLADPRARQIIEREAPALLTSDKQGLFPQTTLRNLQPAMPEVLTDAVLSKIKARLAEPPRLMQNNLPIK